MARDTTSLNTECHIELDLEYATQEDLERGVTAAVTVFERARVDPWEAAIAHHEFEWGSTDSNMVTDEAVRLSSVYGAAIEAALKAACEELPDTPKRYDFRLRWDGEEPRQPSLDALEVVYPTTEFGRPSEEIPRRLTGTRRRLIGRRWEWI